MTATNFFGRIRFHFQLTRLPICTNLDVLSHELRTRQLLLDLSGCTPMTIALDCPVIHLASSMSQRMVIKKCKIFTDSVTIALHLILSP